jgi:hypothetical protein
MVKEIIINDNLNGVSRPIYLVGIANYEENEGIYKLVSKVLFPSSEPSIDDRVNNHPIPHVNVGDAFFGVWNGVHLICNEEGFYGTLTSNGQYDAFKPIPADVEVTLELVLNNLNEINNERSDFDVKVDFEAKYKNDEDILMVLKGNGFAKKKGKYFYTAYI